MEYNSRRIGKDNEEIAVEYLQKKGYSILEVNFRNRNGEIDIIAKDGTYIVFVEVKFRGNAKTGYGMEAVDFRKQRQISDVSVYYLKTKGFGLDVPCRYDVVSIDGNGNINHITDAFQYCGRYK